MSRSLLALCALLQYCGKGETERERERQRESKGDCQKHYTISKQPVHSQQSFDSGQGGVWVTKAQGEKLGELFKEGSPDLSGGPHVEGRVGWMELRGSECFSAGCPAVTKKKKLKRGSLSVSVCLSVSPVSFPSGFSTYL